MSCHLIADILIENKINNYIINVEINPIEMTAMFSNFFTRILTVKLMSEMGSATLN